MIAKINQLLQEVEALKAANAEELEALRIKYLSKKGAINDLMADFRNVAAEQKKEVGMKLNELKTKAQEKINALKEQFDNLNTLGCVSFGNIQGVCTCEVPAATNATRLSWLTQRTYNFTGNGWVSRTWYMYLDNIRVTIVK